MVDNTTLPGTGDIISSDAITTLNGVGIATGEKVQRVKVGWGIDSELSDTTATSPLPTSTNASIFRFSTNNSSSLELASNATFVGTLETALDQPSISLLMTSDQPMVLTIYQYIDVAGTYAVTPIVYSVAASQGFSASFALNGNYVKVTAKNVGTATTTTFELNTAYGTLPASDGTGRLPIATADCVSLQVTTATTVGPLAAMDTNGFGAIVSQISGIWSGAGFFEVSNDLVVWDNVLVLSRESLSLQDTVTTTGTYTIRPSGRYLRFNVNVITGTLAINSIGRDAEGVNASDFLSLAMDTANNAALNVNVKGLKQDSQGALVLSDNAGPYIGISTNVTIPMLWAVDTTGYQSFSLLVDGGVGSVTVSGSQDLVAWSTIQIAGTTTSWAFSQTSLSFSATGSLFLGPCNFRYLRINLAAYTSGNCRATLYLRQQPVTYIPSSTLIGAQILDTNSTSMVTAEDSIPANTKGLMIAGIVRNTVSPATIIAGDAARPTITTSAALVVEKHSVPELTWSYAAPPSGLVNTTTAVAIKAAIAAQRGNISSIQIQHEPMGAATEFAIRDGAAGTVLWRIKFPQTTAEGPMQFNFDPPLRQAAVNTLLEIVTLTASVTGAVYFNAQGFMSN